MIERIKGTILKIFLSQREAQILGDFVRKEDIESGFFCFYLVHVNIDIIVSKCIQGKLLCFKPFSVGTIRSFPVLLSKLNVLNDMMIFQ